MRGVVLMVVGIALFALTDVTTKWLSAGYGAAQVIAMRCGTALLVAGPLAWRQSVAAPNHTKGLPVGCERQVAVRVY